MRCGHLAPFHSNSGRSQGSVFPIPCNRCRCSMTKLIHAVARAVGRAISAAICDVACYSATGVDSRKNVSGRGCVLRH
jgi:hypothetical protein